MYAKYWWRFLGLDPQSCTACPQLVDKCASSIVADRLKSKDRQHNGQKKKDKQRSTKLAHKTKDWVTQTPLNSDGELRCSGRVSSSCSTSSIRHFNLVTHPMISHEFGKDREVFTTNEQYLHIEYISLSWYDIPELVVPIRISLIKGCC
jgi:hypothetical protein